VQTPTLAMLVKREREIQAFVAEPYWLVHAAFQPPYQGIWFEGDETRIKAVERADEIVGKVGGKDGTITKVERKEQSERAPLLYDLTSLQRDSNRRYGFSARRTLQAAQSLYEGKKAITYPRTSSRYLSGDMVPQLKTVASSLQDISDYREAATFVMRLDQLPLGRVINDAKVTDHHASSRPRFRTTSRRSRPTSAASSTSIARASSPSSIRRRGTRARRIVTEVEGESFRTRGKITLEAGGAACTASRPKRRSSRRKRTAKAASCRRSRRARRCAVSAPSAKTR
jgi:Topoisomerase IA